MVASVTKEAKGRFEVAIVPEMSAEACTDAVQ